MLGRANRLIQRDGLADTFLTACYASVEINTGRIVFANAGHNPPLRLSASGEVEELSAKGIVLGAFDDVTLEEREAMLDPGDLLICYTDGVSEASGAGVEPFGEQRLHAVVQKAAGQGAGQVITAILEAIDAFTSGSEQFDDITLVAVRREPLALTADLPSDWSKLRLRGDYGPGPHRRRTL